VHDAVDLGCSGLVCCKAWLQTVVGHRSHLQSAQICCPPVRPGQQCSENLVVQRASEAAKGFCAELRWNAATLDRGVHEGGPALPLIRPLAEVCLKW